jgi:hypothetical protein
MDLTATSRVPYVNCVFQIEVFSQFGEIVSIGVHVIAMPGLARAAVTAPIVSDTAVAPGRKKEHLVLKCIC